MTESHAPAPARSVTVRAPLGADRAVEFGARLPESVSLHSDPHPRSWFVTHGLGTIAGGTYTEVLIDEVPEDEDGAPLPEHVLDAVVRAVAVNLYGTAWAFHYRPNEYASAIERWNLRRREVVVVEGIEVL